ncbi:MAG: glycosyl transferase [Bacteroidota bacterium]
MYNFCTLFDSNYLTRGLAMYNSLKLHCNNFHLYIFAFDEKAYSILNNLALEKVTVISLKDFESEDLLAVKPSRSIAEYCWTCTSSTIKYVLDNYKAENCTYIDADLFFYSSPKPLFDEMGDKSVLITEHRYSKSNNRLEKAGKYCVQFITFKNNEEGLKVLNWWRNACIEWCFDRYEDGKFGDQKYLDDWTSRFKGVHELVNLGGGVAPWNVEQYKFFEKKDLRLFLKTKQDLRTFEVVFYHFHYVRFYKNNLVDFGWFKIPKSISKIIYFDYVKELDNSLKQIKTIDSDFKESLRPFSLMESKGLKNKLKVLIKLVTRYNLYAHVSN